MKKRLQVILAHSGISSRRKAVEIIEAGFVRVDGKVVRERGYRVDPQISRITVCGRPVGAEGKVYIVLNKPKGVITSSSDERSRKTVLDLVQYPGARLYPVGRLDKDTEGVILLTNDGNLANRLMHPRYEIDKIYLVQVKGRVEDKDIRRMEKGVFMDGKKTAPCVIMVIKRSQANAVLKVNLHEGRKRQIRRMVSRVGGKVSGLKRISYAGITADGLRPGEWRPLHNTELKMLKNKINIGFKE